MKKTSYGFYSKQQQASPSLGLYKALLGVGGLTYLIWWALVELTLPGSFNPIGSRLATVFFCWGLWGVSLVFPQAERYVPTFVIVALGSITTHYFYLFHSNQTDINWVVGAYITIIAGCACLQTEVELLIFSVWVLSLSVLLSVQDRILLQTVFLPGVFTILAFAYIGLRARLRWLKKSLETSRRFQNLFDAVFEGIVVHDRGTILDANESFAKLFGYQLNEVLGKNVSDFVLPESLNLANIPLENMSEVPYQIVGLKKDGSKVIVEIRGKPHLVGDAVCRLAVISDITDRMKREQDRVILEASEKAVRMRDEFLLIASHELKTPLTNIKIQTQMVLRSLKKGDPHALSSARMDKFVEQMDRQADRLTRLVEEMLDVSRISTGKLFIDFEEFNFSQLVYEVAANFEGTLKQGGVELKIEAPETCPIRADRFRLEQVISNLFSNALKYGRGKPIQVRLESSTTEIRLVVKDQGIGISLDNLDRIFQRFERAISSRKISGLGLGLYIAKDIIQAHGGRIEVSSQLEEGTQFTVFIPIRIAEIGN